MFLKPLPLLVFAIIAWSYYAYVYEMCIVKMTSAVKRIVYLIFLHVFLIILLVHYFLTMWINPGEIPDEYKFSRRDLYAIKSLEQGDPAINRMLVSYCNTRGIKTYIRKNNCIRYCLICKMIKPDRAHHCSSCRVCVIKMDHHCPWVDNCIGFTNYKIFLLMILYGSVYCLYYSMTSLEYVILFFTDGQRTWWQLNYVLAFVTAAVIAILLMCLFGFHWYALIHNETTLESLSDDPILPDDCTFNLGTLDNVLEVCGYNWCLWCIPVPTSLGDGVEFPIICP